MVIQQSPNTQSVPVTSASEVVIAIPTLNEEEHIAHVLEQLLANEPYAAACQCVVMDGGSRDKTREIVQALRTRYPNLSLVDNPKRTQAHAMNLLLGPIFEDAKIAIRCDAHAEYPPGFVQDLVRALETKDEASSVVISMDARSAGSSFRRGFALVADTKIGAGGAMHRGGQRSGWVAHGHHAAFRLDKFRELGGYDTSFRANEDAEYDQRLIQTGGRIWLDAEIRIGYFPRDTLRGLWKQYWQYGLGRARNCAKHRTKLALRQMIPLFHVILIAIALFLSPFTLLALLWPLAYLIIICGTALALFFRHKMTCALWAAPALAAMHTAWGLGFIKGWMTEPKGLRA